MVISKELGRFASLNNNIYIAADPTPVDIDHSALAGGPTIFTYESWRPIYFKLLSSNKTM